MEAAGDHPVPSGPLAVRWLACDPDRPRAGALGTARLAFENAGTVPWPPTGERRVCLGYHWLDELGNPIVWDGLWTALPRKVAPGERVEAGLLRRPPPPLAPYAPGGGRNPAFEHPLLCPSLVREVDPTWTDPVEGLPALEPPPDEPWLYDGRIQVTARLRSGRRPG